MSAGKKDKEKLCTIALAGSPNVGKSTVFNAVTGLHQHTGNWTGKTVDLAEGRFSEGGKSYRLVDLPGTYSMSARSAEEACAADFLLSDRADAVVVVCDATCLWRNLSLVLQILELTPRVVVCVNLLDEAKKKGIRVDFARLSERLGVPVVGTDARKGEGVEKLKARMVEMSLSEPRVCCFLRYPQSIEEAIATVLPYMNREDGGQARAAALYALRGRTEAGASEEAKRAIESARGALAREGLYGEALEDALAATSIRRGEELADEVITCVETQARERDRKIDRILTGRFTGIPLMLLLLGLVFWLTMRGANVPTAFLTALFDRIQRQMLEACMLWHVPEEVYEPLIFGVYRVMSWVISVMLPPMAIFFPLFTLLEDFGYLPRIAFHLDHAFQKCRACGKQALTMCMGFGCNAAGVVGCRIIDSPRERLIAILTNCFVPCNGRFPMMIAVIGMFFAGGGSGALILTVVVLFGILMTFLASYFLSKTFLKGENSAFTLELPPYRRPQIGQVLIRSVLDRTLLVLGRAAAISAPAGLLIWCFANYAPGGVTLLERCSVWLEPLGRAVGMDGCILLAFLLGMPANEIVIPILLMTYLSAGNVVDIANFSEIREILVSNGWTWVTAVNFLIFSLMHWPCTTTLLTIRKESGKGKWTLLSFLLPAAAGFLCCFIFTGMVHVICG